MSLLVESIKIYNGRVRNIKYHNRRCNESRRALFRAFDQINLRTLIQIPHEHQRGLVKCRITYNTTVQKIEFETYQLKRINSLKCVISNQISYMHKFQDRLQLDELYHQRSSADDIIIVKEGMLTDSYYGNLAFFDGHHWDTPAECLLEGTMRAKLLDQNRIRRKPIHFEQLQHYEKVSVFNALIPFKHIIIPIDKVYL